MRKDRRKDAMQKDEIQSCERKEDEKMPRERLNAKKQKLLRKDAILNLYFVVFLRIVFSHGAIMPGPPGELSTRENMTCGE